MLINNVLNKSFSFLIITKSNADNNPSYSQKKNLDIDLWELFFQTFNQNFLLGFQYVNLFLNIYFKLIKVKIKYLVLSNLYT